MIRELIFLAVALSGAFAIGLGTAWLSFRALMKREQIARSEREAELERRKQDASELRAERARLRDKLAHSVDRHDYAELKRQVRRLEDQNLDLERRLALSAPAPEGAQAISEREMMQQLGLSLFKEVPPDEADDLQAIKGIGPFIEEKLNRIGVRTYQQLSKLSETDVRLLNEAIECLPGRIKQENWVEQARQLLNEPRPRRSGKVRERKR